jgi:hypothetical protein
VLGRRPWALFALVSAQIIKAFAEHYIRESLGLKDNLFLAYRKRGEVPVYIDPQALRSGQYHLVPQAKSHLARLNKKT